MKSTEISSSKVLEGLQDTRGRSITEGSVHRVLTLGTILYLGTTLQ